MSDSYPISQDYADGITCIDANYIKSGLACFYLLAHNGEYALIETGTGNSLANLASVMRDKGISAEQVRYVIPTHMHLDHAGGAGAMMARFPRAQLVVHPRGAAHLVDPERLVRSSIAVYGEAEFRTLYGDIAPIAAERVIEVNDGAVLHLGGRQLEFRHTEGHARHHFCVWDETSNSWFTGDMFGVSYPWFRYAGGSYVMPSTTPTQFHPEAFHVSLDLLHSYSPRQLYLTHYGELSYSAELSDLLRRQVDAFADRARQCKDAPAELSGELRTLCADLAGQIPGAPDREQLLQQMSFDADLNAQGLQVWLQRLARTG